MTRLASLLQRNRQVHCHTTRLLVERLEDRRVLDAGDLDLTFDGDGLVATDVGNGRGDQGADVALQADGKLVVAGHYNHNKNGDDFAVVRYNADGSLDTTFGTGGIVRTSFNSKNDRGTAVAIQADGKIVVGGYATVSNKLTFAVARYNTNGSLDTSFDGDGKLTTDIVSGGEELRDIVIQPDGKIVAAGLAAVGSGSDIALVRYNPNGSLDATFGTGGKVSTPGTNDARAVALASGGKIVVSGDVIARYNSNGTLDTSFSGNGIIENPDGRRFFGVAVQPDDKVVVTDWVNFEILRFDSSGNLDPTFAGDGTAYASIDVLYDVAVQADGKIVASGQGVFNGNIFPMYVVRLNADGTPDASFGAGGLAEAPFPNSSVGRRVLIQPDGKIVSAGYHTNPNGNWNFAIARFEGDPPPAPLAAGESASPAADSDVALLLFLMEGSANRPRRD